MEYMFMYRYDTADKERFFLGFMKNETFNSIKSFKIWFDI